MGVTYDVTIITAVVIGVPPLPGLFKQPVLGQTHTAPPLLKCNSFWSGSSTALRHYLPLEQLKSTALRHCATAFGCLAAGPNAVHEVT